MNMIVKIYSKFQSTGPLWGNSRVTLDSHNKASDVGLSFFVNLDKLLNKGRITIDLKHCHVRCSGEERSQDISNHDCARFGLFCFG